MGAEAPGLMRIALVYDGVYPYSVGGGEKIFHDLARHLGQRHEVTLMGLKLWPGERIQTPAPGVRLVGICEPEAGFTVQAGPSRSLKQATRFALAAYRALDELGPFDLVDCMATPYIPLYAVWLKTRTRGVALVSTWLELWEREHWREYLGSDLKAWVAWHIEHQAIGLPRHIISISPQTSEGLLGSGVKSERLTTITPWADLDAIAATAEDGDFFEILFAGRLIRSKGVELLLRALALLPGEMKVRCRIVGDGPERGDLEALRDELGLGARVVFSGFLESHGAVIAAMKSCDVFALPSSREGFGIVVVEAAACGAVCVTIDTPNNASRHLVRESGVGMVCGAEPTALAEALARLLSRDGAEREADRARSRAWAERYGWTTRAAAYEAIYREAAGHG